MSPAHAQHRSDEPALDAGREPAHQPAAHDSARDRGREPAHTPATHDPAHGTPSPATHETQPPPSLHEALTARVLLQQPGLRAASVLAGREALDRPVTTCLPWTEVLAGVADLQGAAVHARADRLAEHLDQLPALGKGGAAGLFLTGAAATLPTDTLDATGVPVVQLPATVGFAQLSAIISTYLVDRDAHVLRYAQTVHRSLAQLHNRGGGLPALTRHIAKVTGCPAFVLDAQGEVVAQDQPGGELPPQAVTAVSVLRRTALPELPGREDEPTGSFVTTLDVPVDDHPITLVVGHVTLAGRHYGWLVVVEPCPDPAPHDLAQHAVVVEEASAITGAELLRMRSVEEAEERARGDFVQALLHGRFANPHDLAARAAHHDFAVDGQYAVVVAGGIGVMATPEGFGRLSTLARQLVRLAPQRGLQTFATVVGDSVVVVRQIAVPDVGHATAAANAQAAEFASAVARELERRAGHRIAVTHGRVGVGAQGVADSYREARIAQGVCARLGIDEVSSYAKLRVFAAIAAISDSEDGRALAREVLGPLRRFDESGGDLEQTVLAYVETGGNLNAAARKLQMHRNTVLYKLDRASRVLGLDLRLAEHRFTVWLASRIDLLSEVQLDVGREIDR